MAAKAILGFLFMIACGFAFRSVQVSVTTEAKFKCITRDVCLAVSNVKEVFQRHPLGVTQDSIKNHSDGTVTYVHNEKIDILGFYDHILSVKAKRLQPIVRNDGTCIVKYYGEIEVPWGSYDAISTYTVTSEGVTEVFEMDTPFAFQSMSKEIAAKAHHTLVFSFKRDFELK